jgi:hypothetical protein
MQNCRQRFNCGLRTASLCVSLSGGAASLCLHFGRTNPVFMNENNSAANQPDLSLDGIGAAGIDTIAPVSQRDVLLRSRECYFAVAR